jgi:hypothetical protein
MREAIRLEQSSAIAYAVLGQFYLAQNRFADAKTILEEARSRKRESSILRTAIFSLAFLADDVPGMDQQVRSAAGKPGAEDLLLSAQADTAAYYGRLQKARQLSEQAVQSAKRNESNETAALYLANEAARESEFGNRAQAWQTAAAALALTGGGDGRIYAALALARAGDLVAAKKLADGLNQEFPLDTLAQRYWLTTIHAELDLSQGKAGTAIELLKAASPYEFGLLGNIYPAYVRGQAYLLAHNGSAAAAEFQKLPTIGASC